MTSSDADEDVDAGHTIDADEDIDTNKTVDAEADETVDAEADETVDASDLLPSPRMRRGALDGDVTQIHRGHRYADEGDTFTIEGTTFEVVDVDDRTLGEITDEEVRKEGVEDLASYRGLLERAHENFEWDDDSAVARHRFERR